MPMTRMLFRLVSVLSSGPRYCSASAATDPAAEKPRAAISVVKAEARIVGLPSLRSGRPRGRFPRGRRPHAGLSPKLRREGNAPDFYCAAWVNVRGAAPAHEGVSGRMRRGCARSGSGDGAQHPAVDVVGRADAVAGLVGAQEHEEARDLLGRGEALDGGVLGGDVGDVVLPGPVA